MLEARQGETVRFPPVLASSGEVDRLVLELSSVAVGNAGGIVIRLVDTMGEAARSFDGVVELEAGDPAALPLPAPHRFIPEVDVGEHLFEEGLGGLAPAAGVTVRAAVQGQPELQAERTTGVLGEGEVVRNAVGFAIEVPGEVAGGLPARPVDVRVTAFDAADHVATGYRGTVTFADSNLAVLALPADTAFRPGDRGSHLFANGPLPLVAAGTATIRVRDVDDERIAGQVELEVR